MWASDWFVCTLKGSVCDWREIVMGVLREREIGRRERVQIFRETALKLYGIDDK